MDIVTTTELKIWENDIVERIKNGAIFIHPSDTIYGLSCNATDKKAVAKLRQLKNQENRPLSVWVPSLAWVREHCKLPAEAKEWLEKLPGPYTIILPLKNYDAVAQNVYLEQKAIGIRLPDHWFGKLVEKIGVPLITTSANKAGQPFMTSLETLDPEIQQGVEFIIYEGEKVARPSKIVDITSSTVKER